MKKHELDVPFKRGETEITVLEVRTPLSGELRGLRLGELVQGDVDSMLILLPRITNPALTKAEAETLSLCDMGELTGIVRGFFEPTRKPA